MTIYDIRTLSRSFKILECLAEAGKPLPAADVSRRVGLHRATAHRILVVLVQLGYVHKNEKDSTYTTGYYLHTFGYTGNIVARITHHSKQFLRDLSANTGETVHLGALEGTSMVFCDQAAGFDGAGTIKTMGMRRDAHATAIGKALLAFQPIEDVRLRYDGRLLPRHTRRTITSIDQLLRSLREIHDRGYAVDDEESESGLRSVAAAIINPAGRATCAIAMAVPMRRLTNDKLPTVVEHVRKTAIAIVDYIVRLGETGYASERHQVATSRTTTKSVDFAKGKIRTNLRGG